jgi:hypothetical protein
MFIEPQFHVMDSGTRVIPDIVICNSRSIIAVIELKYRPRGSAVYQKDIRTLDLLATCGVSLSLSNERFSGPLVDGRVYGFATKTLFVWGGFHRQPKMGSLLQSPFLSTDFDSLAGRFLQLHAETSHDAFPEPFHLLS